MRSTTISRHHRSHHTRTAAFWTLGGIVALITFADALTVLAVALAIVMTARWIYRDIRHRMERNDTEMAPVTHLRAASTDLRDLKKTSAHASWRGASAA